MVYSPGWYPDLYKPALLRWWDGASWTDEWLTPTTAAGWYPAPEGGDHLRWWNGALWTDHAMTRPTKAHKQPAATFDSRAVRPAVIGIAASVVAGQVLAAIAFDHLGGSITIALAALYVTVFAGLAATCLFAARRYGTGRLSADFGWNLRFGDLWRGPLALIVVVVVEVIVYAPWANDHVARRSNEVLHSSIVHVPVLATIEFVLSAVVAAPLLEELAFRGLLQRALTGRLGVVGAIFVQALCFGAYHYTPGLGRFSLPRMLGAAAFGLIAGAAAARWKRLGPGVLAHALFNSLFVIAILAAG